MILQYFTLIVNDINPCSSFTRGKANGYVILPKKHPLHGMDYLSIYKYINLNVHGGLTFSNWGSSLLKFLTINEYKYLYPKLKKDDWIIGFDTAHLDDNQEKWPEWAVLEEAKRLAKQLERNNVLRELLL